MPPCNILSPNSTRENLQPSSADMAYKEIVTNAAHATSALSPSHLLYLKIGKLWALLLQFCPDACAWQCMRIIVSQTFPRSLPEGRGVLHHRQGISEELPPRCCIIYAEL
jgi:hypothetical protein